MKIALPWRVFWSAVWVLLMFPSVLQSAPIKIDFSTCQNATYVSPVTNMTEAPIACCPLLPTKPIVDGVPPPSTDYLRVRQASQCTDAEYAAKIDKAYALMRALPDDDPRSFFRQWQLHCAYCGGSFLTYNSSGDANGIDIHFSWLFLPWHRYYLFFHERILQHLLGDPTFSLNYWNWDGPFSIGQGTSKDGKCLSKGDNFPSFYNDQSKATYDTNRSQNAMDLGQYDFASFQLGSPVTTGEAAPSLTAEEIIESNMNIMYNTMVSGGTNAETFMGLPYRAGAVRGNAFSNGGAGSMEQGPHPAVHSWVGTDLPASNDMGYLATSSRDPVFYGHHSNIDRMWNIWKSIGPLLGQDHTDWADYDFLETEFLFYDENKDLRRVKVKDSLDTTKLGYVYQEAEIAQWLSPNQTICSTLNYTDVIAASEWLPRPVKGSSDCYNLMPGDTLNFLIERPNNTGGLEEFLTISGIQLDRTLTGGFDVFVDLVNPTSYRNPWKCAEYSGRFTNMAKSRSNPGDSYTWKQSITRTFGNTNTPDGPTLILISIVSMSKKDSGDSTIYFNDVSIDLGSSGLQQTHSNW